MKTAFFTLLKVGIACFCAFRSRVARSCSVWNSVIGKCYLFSNFLLCIINRLGNFTTMNYKQNYTFSSFISLIYLFPIPIFALKILKILTYGKRHHKINWLNLPHWNMNFYNYKQPPNKVSPNFVNLNLQKERSSTTNIFISAIKHTQKCVYLISVVANLS